MLIEISECPVCMGRNFTPTLSCKDFTVSHETFQLIRCNDCHLLITSPRPANEDLAKYYFSDDYISHSDKPKGVIDKVYRLARHFTLNWKLNLVKQNSPHQQNLNLLDYGCGTGDFLRRLRDNGHTVTGVEPSDKARTLAQQNTASKIVSSIDELDDQTYHAITLWHVLEHVPDLNEILSKLTSRLKDNGTMFIAVPNHNSSDAEHYGTLWAGYDVPRHLWHFTKPNMKLLIEKHKLTQVNILPMKLDAFYVSMLSEKYRAGTQTIGTLLKAFATGLKSNSTASATNNYSSLIYIFKKCV